MIYNYFYISIISIYITEYKISKDAKNCVEIKRLM